jgi:hypothetical protein
LARRSDTLGIAPDATGISDAGLSDSEGLDGSSAEAGPPVDALDGTADLGTALGPDAGSGTDAEPPAPVTVVVLPDTQYYASSYPDVFPSQTDWIYYQKASLNIAAVLHVGDVVDGAFDENQWKVANASLRVLDGVVPYVLVPGNHDTDDKRKSWMSDYFGPTSMPWITGTMTAGQIENNYALIDIGPKQWIVLGLEFGPRDAVIAWADTVLKAYADRPAIIVTHAYLYHDGTRYNVTVAGNDPNQPSYQYWCPSFYGFTASQGINDGEDIWRKLILTNPNVRLVFSGHDTGAALLSSPRPDGSVVHQMLSDYQWYRTDAPDYYGGGGYLRILQFDYGKGQISVRTYSPFLNNYLTDASNQFTISLVP